MATDRIETLIGAGKWTSAQSEIEKQLAKEPDDHWLWSRLSGVKYEQRDYPAALDAARRALEIVPDCPLALWSCAGALEMLGQTKAAGKVYVQLIRRGVEELTTPDEDAEECWEGADWTGGLVVDCIFRCAGCLARMGEQDKALAQKAVKLYQDFLNLLDFGMKGIYSRKDAVARLKKLVPSKKAIARTMERAKREVEGVLG